jgi:hypothetical protein
MIYNGWFDHHLWCIHLRFTAETSSEVVWSYRQTYICHLRINHLWVSFTLIITVTSILCLNPSFLQMAYEYQTESSSLAIKNQLQPQFGVYISTKPSTIWMVKRTDSTNFKSYCAVRSLYQPDVFTAWLVGLQARRLTLNRNWLDFLHRWSI